MYGKIKGTVPKVMLALDTDRELLRSLILSTMRRIASMVGATLGPGGRAVLLERQEEGLPPALSKDGVTVFRALGDPNPTADNLIHFTRDAAVRTANEAGDGTTTATVLAAALVDLTDQFCTANPKVSPQWVVRQLTALFNNQIEKELVAHSVKPDATTTDGLALCHAVARISANGDTELADAVIECLKLVGDEGNVTILEASGPSGCRVEPLRGFPIGMGYDTSCRRFFPKFINDESYQRCVIERPSFLLYHGRITDIQSLRGPLEKFGKEWEAKVAAVQQGQEHPLKVKSPNIVVVATEFSDNVLGQLAFNFEQGGMRVFPLVVPLSPIANGQAQFLLDLAAVTGAKLLDPINHTLDLFHPDDLGPGVEAFEAYRFRSNVIGHAKGERSDGVKFEKLLLDRIDAVKVQSQNAESVQDAILLKERLAKLTCGIAQLIVSGASNGELKERRDRAEDAVCAVRGAIKFGCLPGGGWGMIHIAGMLRGLVESGELVGKTADAVQAIMIPALEAPLRKLLDNAGQLEADAIVAKMYENEHGPYTVFDAMNEVWGDAYDMALLDSAPAVIEALRNAISIGLAIGQLGGVVSFYRDHDLERQDAASKAEFLRNVNINPANERA